MESFELKKKISDAPDDEVLGLQIAYDVLQIAKGKSGGVFNGSYTYKDQDLREVESTIKSILDDTFGTITVKFDKKDYMLKVKITFKE